ncbi:zinc finger protein 836-like [Uranotaenia lowii]|uniref:zinc finger protein 836-like n=1 Tax=Uranotaenia lowii TaxID=190385 RepID=UPI0024783D35|nr:zinc finger protein 836-like [Uranotaenia lowii]
MNPSPSLCRVCLAEASNMLDLYSSYEIQSIPTFKPTTTFPIGTNKSLELLGEDSSSCFSLLTNQHHKLEETEMKETVHLGMIYQQLTGLSIEDQQIPTAVCLRCTERLKEFYLFRKRATKVYEELQTKANIAAIISQLDQQSSVGSVRNDRLEEDFTEDFIAGQELADEKNRFKKPLAAGEKRCEVCQKVFKNKKMLARHQEIHAKENQYKCRYCGRWFKARSSWYNHELKHRNAVGRTEKLEREFLCDICAKTFKTRYQLKEHTEIVHQGTKRFRCDICSKTFTRNGSLAEHKLIQHAEIKQFSCGICSKSFGKEDSLKTHLTIHLGKPFQCEICSKGFAKKAFLTAHISKFHPSKEGPKVNCCDICDKRFSTSGHLKDHMKIHSNEKPEKCKFCGASFRQKQQLKVHLYQHLGKPFKCQFCTQEFGIKCRMVAHLEKNHSTELQNLRNQSLAQQNSDPMAIPPDFGDGAINEEILNEICYQIDANQIMLQNIDAGDEGVVNLIYSSNENIVFFDDPNNLTLPEEIDPAICQLYSDFANESHANIRGQSNKNAQ